MRVVVLGGYGNFGTRICRALAGCPDIDLFIAGRNKNLATRLASEIDGRANPISLDIQSERLAESLRDINAELVIHTAGPFQALDYTVPIVVAKAGAHYIDLADGRRYVCDFSSKLDAIFRESGHLAITGASTVPALSSAVINELTQGWQQIKTIDFCIAPAQTAPRGEATLAGVLSYCGAPIDVWQEGRWVTRYGWAAPESIEFARLNTRIGALCDIPDLELFPTQYPGVKSVMFRAALEIKLTQQALAFMAVLKRKGLIKQPERFAKLLTHTAGAFDFLGSALGGMVVRVSGTDMSGKTIKLAWHVAAGNNHGPEIPCMAAILLARSLAKKELTAIGAHTSIGWLKLADFEPEFEKWGMVTDITDESIGYGA